MEIERSRDLQRVSKEARSCRSSEVPCPEGALGLSLGFQPSNRSRARHRARYRALIVGGQKRVTLGDKLDRRHQRVLLLKSRESITSTSTTKQGENHDCRSWLRSGFNPRNHPFRRRALRGRQRTALNPARSAPAQAEKWLIGHFLFDLAHFNHLHFSVVIADEFQRSFSKQKETKVAAAGGIGIPGAA